MNRILFSVSLAAALSLLAGCESTGEMAESASGGDLQAQFEKSMQEAQAAYKSADEVGGAWAYTEDLLKDAKTAAAKNDYTKAMQLAKEAYDQSLAAKQQYDSQVNAGPHLF